MRKKKCPPLDIQKGREPMLMSKRRGFVLDTKDGYHYVSSISKKIRISVSSTDVQWQRRIVARKLPLSHGRGNIGGCFFCCCFSFLTVLWLRMLSPYVYSIRKGPMKMWVTLVRRRVGCFWRRVVVGSFRIFFFCRTHMELTRLCRYSRAGARNVQCFY